VKRDVLCLQSPADLKVDGFVCQVPDSRIDLVVHVHNSSVCDAAYRNTCTHAWAGKRKKLFHVLAKLFCVCSFQVGQRDHLQKMAVGLRFPDQLVFCKPNRGSVVHVCSAWIRTLSTHPILEPSEELHKWLDVKVLKGEEWLENASPDTSGNPHLYFD
jgi:hypothetical protein